MYQGTRVDSTSEGKSTSSALARTGSRPIMSLCVCFTIPSREDPEVCVCVLGLLDYGKNHNHDYFA